MLIKAVASPIQDKGKLKEEAEMEEGAIESARSVNLTVSKYFSMFHTSDRVFMYSWIDNKAKFRDEEQADHKGDRVAD